MLQISIAVKDPSLRRGTPSYSLRSVSHIECQAFMVVWQVPDLEEKIIRGKNMKTLKNLAEIRLSGNVSNLI